MLLDEVFPPDQDLDEALNKWKTMAAAMGLGALAHGAFAAPPSTAPTEIASARIVPGTHPNYPSELRGMERAEPQARRDAFLKAMLPLIHDENSRIEQDRRKLKDILQQPSLTQDQQEWLDTKMRIYRALNSRDLLQRMDTIPASLVLAQAAVESGWGQDKLSRHGLSFFGQKAFTSRDSIRHGKSRYASFQHPGDSISSYINNLNSHPSYQGLRDIRSRLRNQGKTIRGTDLLPGLIRYSERGQAYLDQLRGIMQQNFRNLNGS